VGCAVHVAERAAAAGAHTPLSREHVDPLHRREVDDDAVVAEGAPADVVSAAANRERQALLARERDRSRDTGNRSMLAFQILRAGS
jgi:hypothetical protein